MSAPTRAPMALFLLTASWAAAFPMMKLTVHAFDPNAAVFLRFALASICLAPWAWRHLRDLPTAIAGIALGLLNQGLFALMATALTEISSARCAFLMSTSVLQVRLLSVCVGKEKPSLSMIFSVAISIVGLLVLSDDEPLKRGDLLTLGAALLFAISILVVDKATLGDKSADPRALVFYQIATTTVIALPVAWRTYEALPVWSWHAFAALVYCAVVATVLAHLTQMHFQKYISTSLAAMLYALEPVLVCAFSTVCFGEELPYETCMGGACLFAGAFLPHLVQLLLRHIAPQAVRLTQGA